MITKGYDSMILVQARVHFTTTPLTNSCPSVQSFCPSVHLSGLLQLSFSALICPPHPSQSGEYAFVQGFDCKKYAFRVFSETRCSPFRVGAEFTGGLNAYGMV